MVPEKKVRLLAECHDYFDDFRLQKKLVGLALIKTAFEAPLPGKAEMRTLLEETSKRAESLANVLERFGPAARSGLGGVDQDIDRLRQNAILAGQGADAARGT